MADNVPEKPKTQKGQLDLIWEAVFNHIPTKLKWVHIKLNFVLVLLGLILAFLAIIIGTGR